MYPVCSFPTRTHLRAALHACARFVSFWKTGSYASITLPCPPAVPPPLPPSPALLGEESAYWGWMYFSNKTNQSRVHMSNHLGFYTPGHYTPPYWTPKLGTWQSGIAPLPQNPLKLFKLANTKSACSASPVPTWGNHNKYPYPQFLSFPPPAERPHFPRLWLPVLRPASTFGEPWVIFYYYFNGSCFPDLLATLYLKIFVNMHILKNLFLRIHSMGWERHKRLKK